MNMIHCAKRVFCCLLVASTSDYGHAQVYEARAVDSFAGSLTNDLRRMLQHENPATEIRQYCQVRGLALSQAAKVLETFSIERTDDGDVSYWGKQAIPVIGRLRDEGSLPFLEEALAHSERRFRFNVIEAIVHIGGTRAVEIFNKVLSNTDFARTDRRLLFEGLMRQSMAQYFERDLVSFPSDKDKEQLWQFLLAPPYATEKMDVILRHDESRCQYAVYCTNSERRAFLSYFSSHAPRPYREEFMKRLESLRTEQQSPFQQSSSSVAVPKRGPAGNVLYKPAAPEQVAAKAKVVSAVPHGVLHFPYVLAGITLVGITAFVLIGRRKY